MTSFDYESSHLSAPIKADLREIDNTDEDNGICGLPDGKLNDEDYTNFWENRDRFSADITEVYRPHSLNATNDCSPLERQAARFDRKAREYGLPKGYESDGLLTRKERNYVIHRLVEEKASSLAEMIDLKALGDLVVANSKGVSNIAKMIDRLTEVLLSDKLKYLEDIQYTDKTTTGGASLTMINTIPPKKSRLLFCRSWIYVYALQQNNATFGHGVRDTIPIDKNFSMADWIEGVLKKLEKGELKLGVVQGQQWEGAKAAYNMRTNEFRFRKEVFEEPLKGIKYDRGYPIHDEKGSEIRGHVFHELAHAWDYLSDGELFAMKTEVMARVAAHQVTSLLTGEPIDPEQVRKQEKEDAELQKWRKIAKEINSPARLLAEVFVPREEGAMPEGEIEVQATKERSFHVESLTAQLALEEKQINKVNGQQRKELTEAYIIRFFRNRFGSKFQEYVRVINTQGKINNRSAAHNLYHNILPQVIRDDRAKGIPDSPAMQNLVADRPVMKFPDLDDYDWTLGKTDQMEGVGQFMNDVTRTVYYAYFNSAHTEAERIRNAQKILAEFEEALFSENNGIMERMKRAQFKK